MYEQHYTEQDWKLFRSRNTLLDDVYRSTWIQMTDKEKANFYDRHIKNMRLVVSVDGQVRIVAGE